MGSYILLIIVIAVASWWVGNTLKKNSNTILKSPSETV